MLVVSSARPGLITSRHPHLFPHPLQNLETLSFRPIANSQNPPWNAPRTLESDEPENGSQLSAASPRYDSLAAECRNSSEKSSEGDGITNTRALTHRSPSKMIRSVYNRSTDSFLGKNCQPLGTGLVDNHYADTAFRAPKSQRKERAE